MPALSSLEQCTQVSNVALVSTLTYLYVFNIRTYIILPTWIQHKQEMIYSDFSKHELLYLTTVLHKAWSHESEKFTNQFGAT